MDDTGIGRKKLPCIVPTVAPLHRILRLEEGWAVQVLQVAITHCILSIPIRTTRYSAITRVHIGMSALLLFWAHFRDPTNRVATIDTIE